MACGTGETTLQVEVATGRDAPVPRGGSTDSPDKHAAEPIAIAIAIDGWQ